MDTYKDLRKVEVVALAKKSLDERDAWQDRAYTAEVRVRGLEEERQKQLAEIERLRGVIWGAVDGLVNYKDNDELIVSLAQAIGHDANLPCRYLINKSEICTCGGIEVAP